MFCLFMGGWVVMVIVFGNVVLFLRCNFMLNVSFGIVGIIWVNVKVCILFVI